MPSQELSRFRPAVNISRLRRSSLLGSKRAKTILDSRTVIAPRSALILKGNSPVPTKSKVLVVWAGGPRSSFGLRSRKAATSRQNREIQFPRLGDRKKYAVGAGAERLSQKRAFCVMPRRILRGHLLTIPKNPKAKYSDPDARVETSNLNATIL